MTTGAGAWIWPVVIAAGIVLIAYLIYAPLTDLWCRYLDRTVAKHGATSDLRISLTFDDGPDPAYTPRVLSVLAERNVPAAFFLVGAKAERHPDIVRQIKESHHLIGTHTFNHRHAYLMTPWHARREVVKGLDALTEENVKPVWFRPPWGAFNLASRLTAGSRCQQIALWNVAGGDWKKNSAPDDIAAAVTRGLKPGAIVVLHDSGGAAGAAERTLAALPSIIDWARDNKYRWVRLDELVAGSPIEGGDAK